MIIYNSKTQLKKQIKANIKELKIYKKKYDEKITILKPLKEKMKIIDSQATKIERNLGNLNELLENIDNLSENDITKIINKYNKKYDEIKANITLIESDFELKNIDNSKQIDNKDNNQNIEIETNDTLLISEILDKVILPYSKKEVLEIFKEENNNYETEQDVIDAKFTRPLSDYKFQTWARYNETIKLLVNREGYKKADAITLALELMGKRFLHPAIISACRTLDELDVYLDCLEKNELNDFKIFNIKYELHPMLVGQEKIKFRIYKKNFLTKASKR